MTRSQTTRPTGLLTLALLASLLAGCVGYYAADPGWGGGYYPSGPATYGGWGDWGGGYRVGPYRGGRGYVAGGGVGHSIPGIPTGARGGGMRAGGGGHGGGGGGHGGGGGGGHGRS
jgi:hypothetical protein